MLNNLKISLSFIGFANAAYLTYKHLTKSDSCIIGTSCEKVLSSSYGIFLGFPLGLYGMIFFAILIYILLKTTKDNIFLNKLEDIVVYTGGFISLGLMSIQFFIIRSFCIFCTLSATIIILIILIKLKQKRDV